MSNQVRIDSHKKALKASTSQRKPEALKADTKDLDVAQTQLESAKKMKAIAKMRVEEIQQQLVSTKDLLKIRKKELKAAKRDVRAAKRTVRKLLVTATPEDVTVVPETGVHVLEIRDPDIQTLVYDADEDTLYVRRRHYGMPVYRLFRIKPKHIRSVQTADSQSAILESLFTRKKVKEVELTAVPTATSKLSAPNQKLN